VINNPFEVRKQGQCICRECGKKWEYDKKYIVDPNFLDLGHTDGKTLYLRCSEHGEVRGD